MNGIFRKLFLIAALSAAVHGVCAENPPQKIEAVPAITAGADGTLHLLAKNAVITGASIRLLDHDGKSHLGSWRDPGDTVAWKLRVPNDGRYLVRIETAAENTGSVIIVKCAGKLALSVPASGNLHIYKTSRVGEVSLVAGKDFTLTLKPVVDGWQPIHVRKVELIPLP